MLHKRSKIMAKPDEFELLMKMNRLPPPSVLSAPLPVKFKDVFSGQSLSECLPYRQMDVRLNNAETGSTPTSKPQYIFFKDPLCPPDLALEDDKNTDTETLFSPVKLGRNMRASHPQFGSKRRKGVQDLMNERKKLLSKQKKQQVEVIRQTDSEQMAAALVNDLLQEGFHIDPPDNTPRGGQLESSLCVTGDGEETQERPEVGERELIKAFHREVKRLTVTEEPS